MNITMISGNLGKDPEVRYTRDSKKIVFISVATTEYRKNGAEGFKEITTWHSCRAMGYAADKLEKQAQKGSRVEIVGHLRNVKIKDGAGAERTSMELSVDKVDVISKRKNQTSASAQSAPLQNQAPGLNGNNGFDE